jgi:hypothetical protein
MAFNYHQFVSSFGFIGIRCPASGRRYHSFNRIAFQNNRAFFDFFQSAAVVAIGTFRTQAGHPGIHEHDCAPQCSG